MNIPGKLTAIFGLALLSTQVHSTHVLPPPPQVQGDEYKKPPKRALIIDDTKEYAYARYVEDWVTKVGRVGRLDCPEAAQRQGLYGSLKLTVSIYADGRIEKVEVDCSSGSKILDTAAIRIVERAAPYPPFPDDMRKKVDILSITRTWTFTRSDQLVGTD
jgi:protein TonB